MAALFLVILAAIRVGVGWAEEVPDGCVSTRQLDAFTELTITGQVYQKDETNIYLKSVILSGSSLARSDALGQSAADSRQEIPVQENIICEMEDASGIPLGSYVAAAGQFSPYSHATNPGEFDAAVYYRTLEVGGKLRKAVLLAKGEESWRVREGLYQLKCYFKDRLYRIFPEKEAAVMSALLLGDKSELDGELKELYKRNGILHILSISSLHITIIGMSIYRLLRRMGLPICPCAVAGSVILILYGCMTGFSVSACRAIGMYLIKMLAEIVGRTYDMLTALGVLAALMVLRNPFYLQNSGFLLSFTSVLGIGVVCPVLTPEFPSGNFAAGESGAGKKLQEALSWIGASLAQSIVASLSITLATLPLQLWFYYEIPVYAVFLNLFVIPFLQPMMITGLLALLVPGLGWLGIIDRLILGGYEFLCGCFDGLPFHTWNPGCPEIWQIAAYYLVLGGVLVAKGKLAKVLALETRRTGWVPGMAENGGAACALSLAVLLFAIRPPARNSVTFLDVGQGDGILVRTASGQAYLFDCGSSSRKNIGRYLLLPCLKYYGIRTLDAVFLSHPDADHVNGAEELFALGSVTVEQLLLPAIEESARKEQLGSLLEAAANAAQDSPVAVGYLSAGDRWDCGSAIFTCLHPAKGFRAEDVNSASECFLVEFSEGGSRDTGAAWTMVLTGDVQESGEEAFLRELQEREIQGVTVLKAAHHGSRNSTPAGLLDQLNPIVTVISSGRKNRYGHPHAELLERLETAGTHIVQTAQSGAVTITCEDGSLVLEAMAEQGR